MPTVLLLSSLDTRYDETLYAKTLLEEHGCDVLLMDVSLGAHKESPADYSCVDVAKEAGVAFDVVRNSKGTSEPMDHMIKGATKITQRLYAQDSIDCIAGLGGASNTTFFSWVMRRLPFGFPKMILSSSAAMPMYAGRYYGYKDITIFHSCVDINGMNPFVRDVLQRFAAMVGGVSKRGKAEHLTDGRQIAIAEFQFCEVCARRVATILEKQGLEVIPFHAQGIGERVMEEMIVDGLFRGLVDLSPAGLAEAILGGNRNAGVERLTGELSTSIPIAMSLCGFDMFSCGPYERRLTDPIWKKRKLEQRKLYFQDEMRVQARTSKKELEITAKAFAEKLNAARAMVSLHIPLRGFSSLSVQGMPLYDPELDKVFIRNLKQHVKNKNVEIVELDCSIMDEPFAQALAERFLDMLQSKG
ncbi:MAG TPA: Tm-1-like ATP-binding domain-containing protein [Syntrophorhabdales bacterium]|nr:Tm-1-like ATP-binding domain-containing protein [Syntrophorhabdales bacterium]